MNIRAFIFTVALSSCLLPVSGGYDCHAIIPEPGSVEWGDGHFTVSPQVTVSGDMDGTAFPSVLKALDGIFISSIGSSLGRGDDRGAGTVRFERRDGMKAEAYELHVTGSGIRIVYGTASGAFYAVQTLRQLLPENESRYASVKVPCVAVTDSPKFTYRGGMLDVARHFFPVEDVKKMIDILALHKMNVMHFHLTDDQGWRVEIGKYPKLTEIGSVRKRTIVGKDPGGTYDSNTVYDNTPHGGYYTRDELRDIVAYAAERFVTVIPEIEFPGHALAAIASYPKLGCTGEQYEVRQTWDIEDRVFCIGRESTFRFFENVLSEVMEIFPSEYIHLGGDECPDKMWGYCRKCRRRMKKEGLSEERQLQGYGIARLEKYLMSHGRKMVGWDEILDAGVTPSAVVMCWRGVATGIKAAGMGNRVIMSPTEYSYFDYYQTKDRASEPLAWGGYLPLAKVYAFSPAANLSESEAANVLGVQANLWTEYISEFSHAEYMLLPRLAAMAEVGWSDKPKDYTYFRERLTDFLEIYRKCGYDFSKTALNEE